MVIGVAGSFGTQDEQDINFFVEQTGVTFPIAWEAGTISQWYFPTGIAPYPKQVLIGPDGTVAYLASEHREGDLRAAIEAVLP